MANYNVRAKPAGILSKPPAKPKPKGKGAPKAQNLKGLTGDQNQAINDRQSQDASLQGIAGGQLGAIQGAYSQPFDWNQGPASPITGDYKGWVDSQMQNYNSAFDKRMAPIEKQQNDDFEQMMANRGIPVGSNLYNQQKSQLLQSQNDARTQAYASGQGQAIQGAESLFNVGTQAHGNAISEAMSKRNMPLNEYNMINAAQSPMMMQNLGYAQTLGAQNNQAKNQIMVNKQSPHGGGGGGGGAGPVWQQAGFPSYQDYQAYQTAQNRANQMWEFQNNPQYRQPKSPSPWASAGGLLGGAIIGGLL